MTVNAPNSPALRSLLLIFPDDKRLVPLSSAGLEQAQNSKHALQSQYRNALLFDELGELRKIESIEVLGPWGKTWFRRALSLLTDGWNIRVQLSRPIQITLSELKSMLIDCAGAHALDSEKEDQQGELLVSRISRASSSIELFALLDLPPPKDLLDVL